MDNHGNLYPSPFAYPPPPPNPYPHLYPNLYPHLYPPAAASPQYYDYQPTYPPQNSTPSAPQYYDYQPTYPPQNSTPSAPPPHPRPSDQPTLFPPSHHQLVHTNSSLGKTQQSKTTSNNQASLKVLLLHGTLMVSVIEAQNLPNLDMFSHTLVSVIGKRLTSDPYVSITVCGAVLGRTFVVSNNENPKWKQNFEFPVAHRAAEVKFIVKDNDFIGAQLIGTVSVPVERIFSGETVEESFPILDSGGRPCKAGAILRLSMQYIPIERLSIYHQGVGGGPRYDGVPGTYFPLRTRGRVTLYQDADVPEGYLPEIQLENGMNYEHGRCWRDMFEAISRATKLVYITGWSVLHTVSLIRGGGYGSDCSLGDLLKSKSQEGVRVLLLVWDDPTSRSILGYRTDGLMQTHDEETRRFFKYSSVQVLLCPRSAGKRHSWFKQKETWAIYTHHQKTVIVDVEAGNNRRKIISFVGGLDLCDGRYDNPRHPLFRTLETLHKDDYHNPNLEGPTTGCPREPWHDLHSRIDGPAAYDILKNFEDRWLKASKHGMERLKRYDDRLLKIERIKDIIGKNDSLHLNDNDPENWHVQVFRSIDSNSVKDFPEDPNEGIKKNLACGKNVLIDMSIHTAYVKAIRSAQHFIYIENQYFLGSSYNWDAHEELGANNLIPYEIALKIANKIKAKERFSAYIVIPMWPEGNPTGRVTQQILYWQNKTMQMMYETIYTALKEVGLENTYEPQDYLNFFCLGNREGTEIGATPFRSFSDTAASAPALLARMNRRFMIYVHSKGMIVDDEYVILGSANINQRSLEGTRDTEIAIGAYQPQHTWARKLSNPRGQIYGYRMSLWAEHIGALEQCFTSPESLVCMRRIRSLGEMNWQQFVADEVTEMKGHLLKYPVYIDRKGKVMPLPNHETFPDIGGKICGTFFGVEEHLTT